MEAEVMTDQDRDDAMDDWAIVKIDKDPKPRTAGDAGNKAASEHDSTDQSTSGVETQRTPEHHRDNQDTKSNNAASQAATSTTTSRHADVTQKYNSNLITGPSEDQYTDKTWIHLPSTEGEEHPEPSSQTSTSKNPTNKSLDSTQTDKRGESTHVVSDPDNRKLTVVVFGKSSAVKYGNQNLLLGPEPLHPGQAHFHRNREVSGHSLSIINILDLHEGEMYLDPLDTFTTQLVQENTIHLFVFVLELGNFREEDRQGIDWLQRKLGVSVLPFVMILFTYEREEDCDTVVDDLQHNTFLEQFVKRCGGRYHTCSKSMNNQSEIKKLLEKMNLIVSWNTHCYTTEMFSTALKPRDDMQEDQRWQAPLQKHHLEIPEVKRDHRKDQESKPEDAGEKENQQRKEEEMENIHELFSRLNLSHQPTFKTADFLQIRVPSVKGHEPCAEKDAVNTFLQRLLMMDYKARYIALEHQVPETNLQHKPTDVEDIVASLFDEKAADSEATEQFQLHPMDIQMAAFYSADHFLEQLMVTKLSQCQYAVPLILPNPFTCKIECPLWTLRQIKKSWKTEEGSKTTAKCKPVFGVETPLVAFFRLGSLSSSKSQLINNLINDRHDTFFHRNCPQNSKTRLLMDGVVEIAWYCPSGKHSDWLTDCTAFCNLRGDAGAHSMSREILTNLANVNVVMMSALGKEDSHRTIIKDLLASPKPLIFILTDKPSAVEELQEGKYKIGWKDRSQADVAADLRRTIQKCSTMVSQCKSIAQNSAFTLEGVARFTQMADEENQECQQAKEAANKVMSLLNNEQLSGIKEKHLPCQGKLWHDWAQKNKSLYRLVGHTEKHKNLIQEEMTQIRMWQQKLAFSPLMKLFLECVNTPTDGERMYFLKWVGILLDNQTADYLSDLHHKYDEQWSKVLELKKKHEEPATISNQQAELERISEELNAATFGVEHILREMGQIYESCLSISKAELANEEKMKLSCLPQIAANIIISGYPLELMDGDAGHVPLVWVSAVLDEITNKLGDQRVFVLSVLGIQSSGKSTMLNAMFGLQFAVGAGRCTRGAFMQLVKVSEEMMVHLQFDYILVVDTEGLRALEMDGKTIINHDNELATFVIGLGNLTLINVFGENPAEMQDILQIVVQAFLRMKKVRLSPSCMFVHQNVGDITAGQQTMEGRRRLQEKLDEMTKLAAKEEVSSAECFSDIISFNIQSDVRYFAQLWEGSPPMAPPNPSYSENVYELKQNILSKISTGRGVKLSEFKLSVGDLWNALLNENFVFSFRNTLEIAVYRKLEYEYSKWTWKLRSTMLAIESKLYNRVNNEKSLRIEEKDLVAEMKATKTEVDESVDLFFTAHQDKEILIQWQERFVLKISDLYNELVNATKRKLDQVYKQKVAREMVNQKKTMYENQLFKLSKDLAFNLKYNETDEEELSSEFDDLWATWVTDLIQEAPLVGDIDILKDVTNILSESYELVLVCERQNLKEYQNLDILGDYSNYVLFKKSQEAQSPDPVLNQTVEGDAEENEASGTFHQVGKLTKKFASYLKRGPKGKKSETEPPANLLSPHDNDLLRKLSVSIFQQTKSEIHQLASEGLGYNLSYIQQIIESVKTSINAHESPCHYLLKKEFTVDLCLYVCEFAAKQFREIHQEFKEANDVKLYLERQRPQYFKVFKNGCKGSASTALFGEFIVDKLEPSILQAAYDQAALDVTEKMKRDVSAFNGNRSNLEKHILTSLAQKESFGRYMEYLHTPKEHFNNFIGDEVSSYLLKGSCEEIPEIIKGNIKFKVNCVMDAVNKVTAEVKDNHKDVNKWLQQLSKALKDVLQFKEESCPEETEITDLEFLQKIVNKGLTDLMSKLNNKFQHKSEFKLEMFRKKPHEIMIEHLCRSCWAQCPFCSAICTNTLEDHTGDHNVRFHRNCGISGWSFMFLNNLGVDFCTTAVSSDLHFQAAGKVLQFKEYRKAGGDYARWNICRDDSEMPYWKWFVCRFQKDLENHYKKRFTGNGEIPKEWRNITKDKAIESLCEL